IDKIQDYVRFLQENSQEIEILFKELLIGVTSFFRDPAVWDFLKEKILPKLLNDLPNGYTMRAWVVACSTGEEAYSLAMLMDELGLLDKSRIFATDNNPSLLALAQAGRYPREVLQKSQDNHREACGCANFPRHLEARGRLLEVAQRYRDRVLFHHHVLGQDGSFNEFQLIVCRNVMIYFDADLQRRVFGLFAQSLHREGFLMLGPGDGLRAVAQACQFTPCAGSGHLYRYAGSS
ncbi:MAG: chemotaxis protein CheB, partial [Verrucomicrobia bacterium]|nr:chemotaxis protein CheB [Verrucomicrobiota bacterium]